MTRSSHHYESSHCSHHHESTHSSHHCETSHSSFHYETCNIAQNSSPLSLYKVSPLVACPAIKLRGPLIACPAIKLHGPFISITRWPSPSIEQLSNAVIFCAQITIITWSGLALKNLVDKYI